MEQRLSISHVFFGLVLDPFYGDYDLVTQMAVELRRKLLQPPITFPFIEVPEDLRHKASRPCMNSRPTVFELLKLQGYDPHLELIHVWCGLARLNTYQPGEATPTGWFGWEYAERFLPELEIDRDEFRQFLRAQELPLPIFWFPTTIDNSTFRVEFETAAFTSSWKDIVRLAQIDDEINKWENTTASTIAERLEKEKLLAILQRKKEAISGLLNGRPFAVGAPLHQTHEPPERPPGAQIPRKKIPTDFLWRKEGDFWKIVFEGESIPPLKNGIGLRYIAFLLGNPCRQIHVSELIGALKSPDQHRSGRLERHQDRLEEDGLSSVSGFRDTGPILDARAKAEYKARLDNIRKELEEAQSFNDLPRAAKLREETSFIKKELKNALSPGGRDRKGGNSNERARKAVTNRIRASLKKLSKEHPALGQHLSNAIQTGTFCCYTPEKPVPWKF